MNASDKKARLLVEASLYHWLTVLENSTSENTFEDEKKLKQNYDRAVSFCGKDKDVIVLFFVLQAALAGYPRALDLFKETFRKVFPKGSLHPSIESNSHLQKLLTELDVQNDTTEFSCKMALAQTALASVKKMDDLNEVAEHLETACLYTNDSGVLLMSALFRNYDDKVYQLVEQAANQGCTDAKKLIHLLNEYESWRVLQKSCYAFEFLLRHVRNSLQNTSDWNSFSYKNCL